MLMTDIKKILEDSKSQNYIGEKISQFEHAIQCADLAIQAKADDEVIVAALLHDIGHLVSDRIAKNAPQMDGYGIAEHENIGADFLLAGGFSQRVANLVKNHVRAKRYLVATNPTYKDQLSTASIETLRHQGGPMSSSEVKEFEKDPDFKDILRLRVWDEKAKVENYFSPNENFIFELVQKLLKPTNH